MPQTDWCDELRELVPVNPNVPYDIREIIRAAADERFFFEVAERFAANIVVGFIRLNGRSVGVVANQPAVLAGCLDIGVGQSGSVRPLLWRVQHSAPDAGRCAGFSTRQRSGARRDYRHGAKLLYAYAEATVPKVTVITQKLMAAPTT